MLEVQISSIPPPLPPSSPSLPSLPPSSSPGENREKCFEAVLPKHLLEVPPDSQMVQPALWAAFIHRVLHVLWGWGWGGGGERERES